MNKRDLRAEIARAVAALPPDYCRRADEAICRAVLASAEYRRAGTLFCYVGTDREIDTRPILAAALRDGKTLAVPLCVGRGIMEARRIGGLEELVPGKYGIPAPHPGCPLVEPGEIDLALIPCCTGNRRGQRLGYGGPVPGVRLCSCAGSGWCGRISPQSPTTGPWIWWSQRWGSPRWAPPDRQKRTDKKCARVPGAFLLQKNWSRSVRYAGKTGV